MPETKLRIAGKSSQPLTRRIAFTATALARLTCPAGRQDVYVYDVKTPGLAYRVMASGAVAFYFVRKCDGRTQRLRLGGREMTIEQARKLATMHNGEIAEGENPFADRRNLRDSATVQELWDKYKDEHLDVRCTDRTRDTDKSRWETCLADWKARRVLSIRESDVRELHTRIGKDRGHVSANRAVQLLRRLFNFARITPNPAAKAVDMFREKSRERFVQPGELPKLFNALDDEKTNPLIRDYLYVSLYTGARRSNVCAMRIEEISLDAGTWTIPAAKSKSGESITLPLSPLALAIIKPRMSHPSGFIFPGREHGKTGHLVEPKATWAAVLKRAKLSDLRLHDLRRTLGSFQAAMGASLPIIGKSLGHRNTAATAIYSRLSLSPVRASVNAATAAMVAAASTPEK